MEVMEGVCYLRELEGKPLLYSDNTDSNTVKFIIEYDHNLFCLLTLDNSWNIKSVLPNWYQNPDLLLFFRDSHWRNRNRESITIEKIAQRHPHCVNQTVGLIPMKMLNIYKKNYINV